MYEGTMIAIRLIVTATLLVCSVETKASLHEPDAAVDLKANPIQNQVNSNQGAVPQILTDEGWTKLLAWMKRPAFDKVMLSEMKKFCRMNADLTFKDKDAVGEVTCRRISVQAYNVGLRLFAPPLPALPGERVAPNSGLKPVPAPRSKSQTMLPKPGRRGGAGPTGAGMN
jgi:hypothetical protein